MNTRPDREVGYKKPPISTQFQPGVSGNPKGRPKGSVSLATVLQKALAERVVVRESGRSRTLSKLEVVMKQVVNKAAGGDMRAIQFLTGLITYHMPEQGPAPAQDPLEGHDQALLASLQSRMRNALQSELAQLLAAEDPDGFEEPSTQP